MKRKRIVSRLRFYRKTCTNHCEHYYAGGTCCYCEATR